MTIEHAIEVRLEGFAPVGRAITPRPGFSQSLPFRLERLDQSTGGGYPRVIQTGAGNQLRLIPAGRFQMGSSRSDPARRRNEVLREVEITRAFYLAENETTNAEYRAVCDPDHDSGSFQGESLNEDDQPVVNVTVQEIFACLNALSIADGLQPVYEEVNGVLAPSRTGKSGYRLATEAEFAWALRFAGREEGDSPRFAWGEDPAPPDRFDNLADLSARSALDSTLIFYTDGFAVSAPVGSFAPNPAGLYDMSGNVAEWVQDYYDSLASPGTEVEVDPLGPVSGRLNVIRGASWRSVTETQLRLTFRDYDDDAREDLGFRIARNLE
jgi:formylglycine-generating enzyme required for sulfatase activity